MKTILWVVLVTILFVSSFGISSCIVLLASVIVFFIGGFSSIYIGREEYTKEYLEKTKSLSSNGFCLRKVVELMQKPNSKYNLDNRLTGSNIIDEELQAILHFIFRDYVFTWYNRISDNEEFPLQLKEFVNKTIVAFANRVKEVDWIPYLTTQLVVDVASHLRLYKQARTKIKMADHKDLNSIFFDLELTMEHNTLCRDFICLNAEEEKCYVQHFVEALLYQIMPETEFHCEALRVLTREILTNTVLLPFIAMISDPDYINRTIMWLCRDFHVSSEIFLLVLKTTNNVEELYATRNSVQKEIATLRCQDSEGENSNSWVRNNLSSLLYLDKIIDLRLNRLQEGSDRDSTGLPSSVDYSKLLSEQKLLQLSLDFILKNNIALSYFIDYMISIGCQIYIFSYLNMEGWKLSAKQELSNLIWRKLSNEEKALQSHKVFQQLRDAAQMLYDQYLSEKVTPRLNIDVSFTRSLYVRIHSEMPSETWFDEIIQAIHNVLQNEEKFLHSFRKHVSYVKLLAELELLKEPASKSDEEDVISADELLLQYSSEKNTNFNNDTSKISPVVANAANKDKQFTMNAKIIETGLVQENGKTFGIYAVAVTKLFDAGHSETWHVYRRYSDFYELHQKLKDKFIDLVHVPFPGKKAFNNIERNLLEKRMKMLNNYMQILLQNSVVRTHPSLQETLLSFLEPGDYDRGNHLAKTFDSLIMNPLKVVSNAVKTMPDNLLNTVDGVMGGFSRVFQKPIKCEEEESMKVGSVLDLESDDNLPLRIMLLLMTEIFDLKTRNQWLRRRIIQLLRQIMHAMFGDIVNKRILDYVAVITSPQRVSQFLTNIRNAFWPNGLKSQNSPVRDNDVLMQTRVATKCALLASFSDDLKRVLGSETSRTGLMLVFSMFQHNVLNKRLVYLLLEGILVTLFPKMNKTIKKLHRNSPRIIAYNQRCKSKR